MCSLDGVLHTERQALIPMLEAGFLTARWVGERMRTEAGGLLAWPEHVARLRARADDRGLALPVDDRTLMRCVVDTMRASELAECDVRVLALARAAAAASGGDGGGGARTAAGPTWVVQVRAPLAATAPVRLAVWNAHDPGTLEQLAAWLTAAAGDGPRVVAAHDEHGHVVGRPDGGALFVWRQDRLCTPRRDQGSSSVERDLLLGFCRREGLVVEPCDLDPDDVRAADDVFFVSTQRGIEPVSHVDDRALHGGIAGKLATDLAAAFEDHCTRLCRERYEPRLAALLAG